MKTLIGSLAALAAAFTFATPTDAEACGGTFCDGGPSPMPVDQTGENILFVMAEDYTEAHIQIQYDPTAEAMEFAWIVPLTEVPEFGVGSDLLFDAVLGSTVPTYGFNTQFINLDCNESESDSASDTAAGSTDPTGPAGTSGDDTSDTDSGGPEILLNEVVGAFEITVLDGKNIQQITTWLDMNGYAQDPNAGPILAEYLAEGYVFAAFKLNNDAMTSEIHPITLRFDNDEACIPLRLTRIAAVDDMDIRSFFLADDRVVPETYRHVTVNPLKLDWPSQASNYKSVITQAVDADEADGRAFVTEYAGSSSVVDPFGIFDEAWSSAPFAEVAVVEVVDTLAGLNLMTCYEDGGGGSSSGGDPSACQYEHPLLRGLLQRYLPVPDGLDEVAFYGCLSCYETDIDAMAWDGAAFAADLEARIIVPGRKAVDALSAFPSLTRMYTTISPGEMTVDPFFYQNADLPDVDNTNQIASRGVGCSSAEIWTLPDGREVYTPNGQWPAFEDEMPWEEEVAAMTPAGAPMVLVNNTATIETQLGEYNCGFNFPSPEACGNPGGTGGETETGSGSGSGSASASGSTTAVGDTEGEGDTEGGAALDDDGGCNCSTGPGGANGMFMLGLFALGLRRRREPSAG